MCGIVGFTGSRPAVPVLLDGLKKLEYRGYDSAGIAVIDGGEINVVKTKGRLSNLQEKLSHMKSLDASVCGIGHTRWATHGEPSDINSHPHSSSRVSIVHNGIIENYAELKDFLIGKGYDFQSETDTETAVKLIDYYYHGDPVAAIAEAIKHIRGYYALGILFRDFPDRIFAVRRESPLIVGFGDGENFIASDVPAILRYTKKYCLLDTDEIATVTKDSVTIVDGLGEPVQKEILTADWDVESAEKGGYPHFMLKEICEQPTALRNTVTPRVKDGAPYFFKEDISDAMLKNAHTVHIVACGTAMHAGIVGKYVIEQLARVPVTVNIASEFRYSDPILRRDDVVIVISQSGETLDTIAAMRLAKQRGCAIIGIVNVVGSTVAREADKVLYTWAGPEIAVASTKAYTVQLALLYLLAIKLAAVHGEITPDKEISLTSSLLALPQAAEKMLVDTDGIKRTASKYMNAENAFFIGRSLDNAVSVEGSLKLKEISYIHSEAYAAGELKHGTISLIVDGVAVVAVATQKRVLEKMYSNIKEVKTRGARVLLVTQEDSVVPDDIADDIIRIPTVDEFFAPLLSILPLQLFAYYMAVLRGCDVDKPRNLAKSVTVE
ncbi:MAG: glutamine--fructose-6-phosphate transaminase (isomerizing) [Oscillospiraceae bacterium]|nr:glutamine--fructose-6-phosphate transaminase (isomerizing) [Oscillospiraceae bacterium]